MLPFMAQPADGAPATKLDAGVCTTEEFRYQISGGLRRGRLQSSRKIKNDAKDERNERNNNHRGPGAALRSVVPSKMVFTRRGIGVLLRQASAAPSR
jgi:hypothetical protein